MSEVEDYQRLILTELAWLNARTLTERIGEEKVMEVFTPHYIHSGIALHMNVAKAMGYTEKDAETLSNVGLFVFESLYGTMPLSRELTEKGLVAYWPGCCLKYAPKVVRRLTCDIAARTMEQALDSECEVLNIQCLDKGSDLCTFVARNKNEPSLEWRLAGSVNKEVPAPSFPEDLKHWFAKAGLGELWIMYSQALAEWLGREDSLRAIGPAMRELGSRWGGRIMSLVDEGVGGLDRLLGSLDSFNAIMGIDGMTTFNGPDRNEMQITVCPFSTSPCEIGMQLEVFCQGLCEAIDDDYEIRFLTKMCGGDKTCHRVVRKQFAARGRGKQFA